MTTALTGALVLTLDSERRMFTDGAVAFDDGGRIVVVGPTAQARDALGDSARIVECTGRVIAPGFVDRSWRPRFGIPTIGEVHLLLPGARRVSNVGR